MVNIIRWRVQKKQELKLKGDRTYFEEVQGYCIDHINWLAWFKRRFLGLIKA